MTGVDHITGWMRRRQALRRRFNPYIVGTPVFDHQLFFGRETLIRQTLARLASDHVRLTGERRIGKTSFLHHLHRRLSIQDGTETRSYPIFVDLEGVSGMRKRSRQSPWQASSDTNLRPWTGS